MFALLLTGCWDLREVDQRSNVLAIGVDACTADQDCKLLVTRQVAIPGRIPLGGGKSSNQGDTVVVLKTGGPDEPTSAATAQMELNRTMTYGHMRIWVLSEEVARGGLGKELDRVRRLAETRRMKWTAVAEGRAEAVIQAKPKLERVPALYLSDMLDDAHRSGRLPMPTEIFFDTQLNHMGEDPVLPLIRMVAKDRPQVAGLAVFRDTTMVGKLSMEETATLLELQGMRKGGELLHVELPDGGWAVLSVFARHGSRTVRRVGGQLQVNAKIDLECELVNLSPGLEWQQPIPAETERRASGQVRRHAEALVERLQYELGADILGIGALVEATQGRTWRTKAEWRKLFAQTSIQVESRVHVRRTGLSID